MAVAAAAAGGAASGLVGGAWDFFAAKKQAEAIEAGHYDYSDYVHDLYYAFGPNIKNVSNDYLTGDFDRFGGLPEKQLGRYAAPMTGEQRSIIDSILSTRDQPRQLNLTAEDQLHQTVSGQYLPFQGSANPYTQSLLDAVHRSSVRGLEDQGPAFQRQLQSIAGGSLRGAGSAMPPISDFYGDWVQRAGDVETGVLANLWQGERSNQMQGLNWALGMPTGLETQRMGQLLPVAEIERSIYDTAIQRAYADFARTEGLDAMRGQQAVGVLSQGAGPPSYGPVPGYPSGEGVGVAVGDAVTALLRRNQGGYTPGQYGTYQMPQTPGQQAGYLMPSDYGSGGYSGGDYTGAGTYFGQNYPATVGGGGGQYFGGDFGARYGMGAGSDMYGTGASGQPSDSWVNGMI